MLRFTRTAQMMRPTRILRENESWREHGISYLKYLNVCTDSVQKCVTDKASAKYSKFAIMGFHAQKFNSSAAIFEPIDIDGVPVNVKEYGKPAAADAAAAKTH